MMHGAHNVKMSGYIGILRRAKHSKYSMLQVFERKKRYCRCYT